MIFQSRYAQLYGFFLIHFIFFWIQNTRTETVFSKFPWKRTKLIYDFHRIFVFACDEFYFLRTNIACPRKWPKNLSFDRHTKKVPMRESCCKWLIKAHSKNKWINFIILNQIRESYYVYVRSPKDAMWMNEWVCKSNAILHISEK